tara:strand:- start:756 stop:1271 length:516 start_codon:yes stop_codon:yes gene_type:complete
MKDEFLKRIPDDIMNIIFRYIKPSTKYSLTKEYFERYYCIRFGYINNRIILYYIKTLSVYDCYIIRNLNYIKFLLKNDIYLVLKKIINFKLTKDRSNYIITKPIIFQNFKYKNFIDFCYLLSIKYKGYKNLDFLTQVIILNDIKISKNIKIYDTNNSDKKNLKNKNKKWIV